jgi:hypothetical protein
MWFGRGIECAAQRVVATLLDAQITVGWRLLSSHIRGASMPDKKFSSVVSSTDVSQWRSDEAGAWKERRYERPPDDHTIFHLVGRVAAEWARLEYSLDRVIWSLSYTICPRPACLTAQFMGTTPRYRALIAQLRLRSCSEPEFAKYIPRIEKMMTQTYEPQDQRNRIIHDPWLVDVIHDEPAQFRSWPHKDPQYGIRDVDIANIKKTISDVVALRERAEVLFNEINVDVGASLKKQR